MRTYSKLKRLVGSPPMPYLRNGRFRSRGNDSAPYQHNSGHYRSYENSAPGDVSYRSLQRGFQTESFRHFNNSDQWN